MGYSRAGQNAGNAMRGATEDAGRTGGTLPGGRGPKRRKSSTNFGVRKSPRRGKRA